eukprot:g479.t1
MAANHSSTTSPVASPLPFRGRHVSGDAPPSAAPGAPRTPPPRGTAPAPGLAQAAGAPASAPAAPQPSAASEGLGAQVATALSQVPAALPAQPAAATAPAAAAPAAKAAAAESAPGANDKAAKTEETPRPPWAGGGHPASTVGGVHPGEPHPAALPRGRSGPNKGARDSVGHQLHTSAQTFAATRKRAWQVLCA